MLNLGDEQTVTPSMSDMQENLIRVSSEENLRVKSFKLMEGRNGPTAFLPLCPTIGGQEKDNCPSIGQYLTREQANFAYKKTESVKIINTETLQQELEYERQLNKINDTSKDTNPYKELIINNAENLEPVLTQMEQWSILSNTLNYIEHDKLPHNVHNLGISTVNLCKKNSGIKEKMG